jgi:type II secretory pathway component PulF
MSKSRKHQADQEKPANEGGEQSSAADKRHQDLKAEIESGLTKIADCAQRIRDQVPEGNHSFKDLAYIAKQLAFLMAAGSDMRRSIEALEGAKLVERAKQMQRERLRDETYTPTIEEALENPDDFAEGFREVET